MKENGGKGPQVNGFSLFSRALAPYLVPKKLSLISPFLSFKTQRSHVFLH